MSTRPDLLSEIKSQNLRFLLTVTRVIREDRESACLLLNMNNDQVDFLGGLSEDEICRLADSVTLLPGLNTQDINRLKKIINPSRNSDLSSMHVSIIMAGEATSKLILESEGAGVSS